MIITRSPLRLSLGGGGTDLPSYYREHEGFLIAAAIDKYVYITVHQTFITDLIIKYSSMERVARIEDVKHPILREALKLVGIRETNLEITSMADIPTGTGLGSSGSFTTAVLKALHTYRKNIVQPDQLAAQACEIEIDRLHEPVGKQDQYIASFGGITCFRFLQNDEVQATPLKLSAETLHNLEDNMVLFFTGFTRSASDILKDQDVRSGQKDPEILDNLHFIKQVGLESKGALERGDLHRFAELMHLHWERKKCRSKGMSNSAIDAWYELARNNGALGGKLVGAGGGGFLLLYTEEKTRLRKVLLDAGLTEVRWRFDFQGTTVISQV
jgi:D-glycero-alpha-D-manno-heptose-7-phosphate kinase